MSNVFAIRLPCLFTIREFYDKRTTRTTKRSCYVIPPPLAFRKRENNTFERHSSVIRLSVSRLFVTIPFENNRNSLTVRQSVAARISFFTRFLVPK